MPLLTWVIEIVATTEVGVIAIGLIASAAAPKALRR